MERLSLCLALQPAHGPQLTDVSFHIHSNSWPQKSLPVFMLWDPLDFSLIFIVRAFLLGLKKTSPEDTI